MSKDKVRPVDLSEPAPIEAEPREATAEVDSTLLTPEAHARETENVIRLRARRSIVGFESTETFTCAHQAAAQMHGWNAHKQATTAELLISRSDYLAALEAVAAGVAHEAALSPYAPKTQSAEPKKLVAAQRKVRR
jgi:hypothetical protein